MKDVQIYSELLLLLHNGAQHRRDTLDEFYSSLPPSDQETRAKVSALEKRLTKILKQLLDIFGPVDLQQHGFKRHAEDDLYALVGALSEADLSPIQVARKKDDLRSALSSFRGLVDDAINLQQTGTPIPDDLKEEHILQYAGWFAGGQINAKSRREQRIKILGDIISEVCGTKDKKRVFSDYERRRLWRDAPDPKTCARCGRLLLWPDYHAGHKEDHALSGPTVLANGQIEHQHCSSSAGGSLAKATKESASGS